MSFVASDLKDLFTINFKSRHDSFTDQYNRMFMVKIILACTIVMGLTWYTDKVNCIITGNDGDDNDALAPFISSTCWIQGMYVYREMIHRPESSAYYGIPKDMNSDGLLDGKHLCSTQFKFQHLLPPGYQCKPMEKTYFLQYQWMPFYIATLALLYYLPYLFFKVVNNDLIGLREELQKDDTDVDIEGVIKSYFPFHGKKRRRISRLTLRQLFNLLIKLLYIVINLVAFYGTNTLLYGKFSSYGSNWLDWASYNNTMAYNYMGARTHPKPGNEILPPFGYCELYSSASDIKTSFGNHHKLLCELSPHILYQYVFIILWFGFIIGIVLSCVGLLILLVNYIVGLIGIRKHRKNSDIKKLFDSLTYREVEYLEFMRKKNVIVYGEVLEKLKERALATPSGSDQGSMGKPDYPMGDLKKRNAATYND